MRPVFRVSALACVIALTGCSSTQMNELGRDHGTAVLCGVGLLGGALLGAAINGKNGALAGAALGTAAGCYAGSVWQSRMQELDRIAKEEGLKISSQPLQVAGAKPGVKPIEAGLVTQVEDESMFATGSDQLTASGLRAVGKLAALYAKPNGGTPQAEAERRLLVVGHTDATGSAAFNQGLSERRARTVGKLLQGAGVPPQRIFYQGAGAARPIADNADPLQRGRNRRVEIVETTNVDVLVKRIDAEENSTRYLAYGTSTQRVATPLKTTAKTAATKSRTPAVSTPAAPASSTAPVGPAALVDFGGKPAQETTLAYAIAPKAAGFSLISSAQAAQLPVRTCEADMPRESGEVLSLATDKPLEKPRTRDYLPGYNSVVWANLVNGHLVTISPVSILKDGARVGTQPFVQVVKGYGTDQKKTLGKYAAVANTYEGDTEVLYRVFIKQPDAAVSCMDVVFSKGNAKARDGALFYPAHGESYTARYVPIHG